MQYVKPSCLPSDLARAFQLGSSRATLGTIDRRWQASLPTDENSDEIFAGDASSRRADDSGETRRQNHSARGRWPRDGWRARVRDVIVPLIAQERNDS